jgi:hypothetical protein
VALKQALYNDPHILLKEEDWKIFEGLDPLAIRMDFLGPHASSFEQSGPNILNLRTIDSSVVVMYLERALHSHETTMTQSSPFRLWLLKLWNWLASSQHSSQILSNSTFRKLPTLSLRSGELVPLQSSIFNTEGTNNTLLDNLEALGLKFLHEDFLTPTRSLLSSALLSPFVLSSVIDNIGIKEAETLSDSVVSTLRELFSRYLPAANLSRSQKDKAMGLPIYNLLSPVADVHQFTKSDAVHGPLSNSQPIQCVPNHIPLPVVPNTVFLDAGDFDLARYLVPSSKSLSEGETLLVAIRVLPNQERFRVRVLIEYIGLRQSHIPSSVLQRLKNTAFVTGGDSTIYTTPTALLDPTCEAASLYSSKDQCIPNDDARIIDALCSLKVFQTTLSTAMAQERIQYISRQLDSPDRHRLAMELIRLIQVHPFEISRLHVNEGVQWIPSNSTKVLAVNDCYDPSIYHPSLFNRVAETVHPSLEISLSLRRFLKWHVPINIGVVVRQFETVVKEDTSEEAKRKDLLVIIEELGRRFTEISVQDMYRLQSLCSTRPSIPVLPQGCASSKLSFFQTGFSLDSRVSFRTINPAIVSTRTFLQGLGCREKYVPFYLFWF